MINRLKKQIPSLGKLKPQVGTSVLGLTIGGGRLEGVVLRRTNGSVQLQQTFSTTLSLDPLTNAAELVGREIRNQLNTAGVRERRCVVALPLPWALTAYTKIPDLPPEDLANFLSIEAERSFPCDVSPLLLSTSRAEISAGERYATTIGIPRSHVTILANVLRAAQLKPVSFSLGLAALQPPSGDPAEGIVALAIGENYVGLQVTSGGGIVALRTLEGAVETEAGQRHLRAGMLAREVSITLARLPAATRDTIRH